MGMSSLSTFWLVDLASWSVKRTFQVWRDYNLTQVLPWYYADQSNTCDLITSKFQTLLKRLSLLQEWESQSWLNPCTFIISTSQNRWRITRSPAMTSRPATATETCTNYRIITTGITRLHPFERRISVAYYGNDVFSSSNEYSSVGRRYLHITGRKGK